MRDIKQIKEISAACLLSISGAFIKTGALHLFFGVCSNYPRKSCDPIHTPNEHLEKLLERDCWYVYLYCWMSFGTAYNQV